MIHEKSKTRKPRYTYFREENIPNLTICNSGNSYSVRIPSDEMKRCNLKVGMKVRPILMLYSPELKTKSFRIVMLVVTKIGVSGSSACINIPMYIVKKFGIKFCMKLYLILVIRDVIDTGQMKPDDVMVIMDGRKEIIPKSTYIKMKSSVH